MILLAEADELSYRIAFGCQSQCYKIKTSKGVWDLKDKYTKTEIIQKYGLLGKTNGLDYTLEPYISTVPEKYVGYRVRKRMKELLSLEHVEAGKIDKLSLWLSGKERSNFRYNVATIKGPKGPGYKAGRGDKPVYLNLVKQILVKEYGAQDLKGFEADDALHMFKSSGTVLCHIDKDIDMVGDVWHYNHVNNEWYFVPGGFGTLELENNGKKTKLAGRGLMQFYAQMLLGDVTDNIPGIKGLGPVKVYALLKDCVTEQECMSIIAVEYIKQYEASASEAIGEIADLLWICGSRDETGRQYLKNKGFI